jgi:hypothetical protein
MIYFSTISEYTYKDIKHPHPNLHGQHPLVMTEGYRGTICTRIPHILATKNSALDMKIYSMSENCILLPAVVKIKMSRNKIVFYNFPSVYLISQKQYKAFKRF